MKVKKKTLRKGMAQLPINYPAPDVEHPFDLNREKDRVENICKRLAEVEEAVRDEVLAKLPIYLKEVAARYVRSTAVAAGKKGGKKAEISDSAELKLLFKKLCYGLFFNYWHSDKPLVQHATAAKIAVLHHCFLVPEVGDLFIECMWVILVREWMKIDKWRLDKYYSLVRKFIHQVVLHIQRIENAEERAASVERIVDAFQLEVVNGNAVGLTMHVIDLLLDELVATRCDDDVFFAIGSGFALYAMSRGNFVEKRALDFFVLPLAANALAETRDVKTVIGGAADNLKLLARFAEELKRLSVSPETSFGVRNMISEAHSMVKQTLDMQTSPESFAPLTAADKRRRIEAQVADADATRFRSAKSSLVDLASAKDAKKVVGKTSVKEVKKLKKGGSLTKKSGEAGTGSKRIEPVGKATRGQTKRVGKNAKSTKRKKIVVLTKKDLESDE